jgi:DNA-binding CsgD family transcriptional regulator/PAS domain-containing protein
MQGSSLPDLIALAYESACDPGGLSEFVAAATSYFGADRAALVIWPRSTPAHLLQFRHALEEAEVTEWFAERSLSTSLFGQLESRGPLSTFQTAEAEEAGWPAGTVLASVVDADGPNCCGLILILDVAAGFSQSDQDTLTQVAGYLRRAVRLNRRFIRIFADHRAGRLILDAAPRGILILDQLGRATYPNQEAERIFGNDDGISLHDNQLVLSDPDAMQAFNGFLHGARSGNASDSQSSAGIRVPRTLPEHAAYQLLAYPLKFDPRQASLDQQEAMAIALLHDPLVAAAPNDALLATYFGLTPAEAHVTQALCAGRSLPSAASELSISVNTARTHLRSVFQKVGVHSQAALVQRVTQSLQYASPLG